MPVGQFERWFLLHCAESAADLSAEESKQLKFLTASVSVLLLFSHWLSFSHIRIPKCQSGRVKCWCYISAFSSRFYPKRFRKEEQCVKRPTIFVMCNFRFFRLGSKEH